MRRRRRISLSVAGAVLAAARAGAAETAADAGHLAGLRPLDMLVVIAYAALLVFIGWRGSRRPGTTHDYFVGRGRLGAFAIGISMFVTLFSTNSYLSGPGEVIRYGPGVLFGMILSVPISYPLLAYLILPTLMKRRVVSLYELFEHSLGPRIRTLGACLFLVYRTIWMGVLLHFAAEALSVILGLGPAWIPAITITIGIVVIIYTSLGGLRAVMIADVIQFYVLLCGALAAIAVVTLRFGGFSWFPTEWNPAWPAQPLFSWDPTVRLTILTITLQLVVIDIAHGVDQTQVQRYMASGDMPRARRAVLVRMLGSVGVWALLVLLGLALVAYYQAHTAALPAGQTVQSYADKLFPFFIAHQLPPGLSGLVVAGILAAGMSSIDSGINAFTAVVMNDFVERHGVRRPDETERRRFAMLLAIALGAGVVAFSLLVGWVPGNYYEIPARTFRLFIPLELGIVILALFVRRATPFGVVWGIVYGLLLGIVISYWTQLTGRRGLSFTLFPVVIFVIQMVVSLACSRIPAARLPRGRVVLWSGALLLPLAALGLLVAALRVPPA